QIRLERLLDRILAQEARSPGGKGARLFLALSWLGFLENGADVLRAGDRQGVRRPAGPARHWPFVAHPLLRLVLFHPCLCCRLGPGMALWAALLGEPGDPSGPAQGSLAARNAGRQELLPGNLDHEHVSPRYRGMRPALVGSGTTVRQTQQRAVGPTICPASD